MDSASDFDVDVKSEGWGFESLPGHNISYLSSFIHVQSAIKIAAVDLHY